MDKLSLLKVLAEPSRYAIFGEMARSDRPLSTFEIAHRLDLHPNTVRIHLEKLRDEGLAEMEADRHGSVGRPQHVWSVPEGAPSLGMDPAGFRMLAQLLAEVAANCEPAPAVVAEAGRRRGAERVSRRARKACLRAVVDELAELGFDPSLEPEEGGVTNIAFHGCPFRDLAVLYPDLVCELHRGLTEGIIASAGGPGARLESFSSLVDADPCRAGVSINA